VQTRFEGSAVDTQLPGCFLCVEFFNVAQEQHFPVGKRQAFDACPDLTPGLRPGEPRQAPVIPCANRVKMMPALVELAGWPWAVARPGLPQIRTCALNAYGSSQRGFATAIRCRRVYGLPGFGAPDPFPFNGSTLRYLLSSPGSLWDRFPWFHGSMKYSDSLPPVSPRFVSFAWRYHAVRLCSSLPQARRRLGARSFPIGNPGPIVIDVETAGSLRFLGDLDVSMLLFLDPGRTSPPGHYGGSARPPHLPTARAPTKK
jgi:hypothetical protein